jgi:hypothetical protein
MASGEMSRSGFTAFLTSAFRNLADHSIDGSIHFLCMGWRHRDEMLAARPGAGYEVGDGKPPSASRFRPGQSGKPKGRPRGAGGH